ncbi:TPA: hypothetical protein QDB19_004390 [Burkholderia vietnamiensis]|uniref:hypothetical protein n=2 Tax=Burkholderia vietnamiensis TaxID=60552 RepID=UPI0012D9BCD8|nr:hypothetical protein [Burkholderia vietnamiensis]MCA7942926.1 hypothetical protein [Burkholderia vietnamiensis]MCA8268784.1 hypothetical protein [Burkholderia vietnamiensis]MDN8039699.1 hypothetical protein [Burkholderia vietnamiensis]MDN8071768.1 hypothetical protein [Burkholderia vietnamiensis]UKV71895.1 hypothetical protein FOC29_08250 [Burkholderia vietnamiensis]
MLTGMLLRDTPIMTVGLVVNSTAASNGLSVLLVVFTAPPCVSEGRVYPLIQTACFQGSGRAAGSRRNRSSGWQENRMARPCGTWGYIPLVPIFMKQIRW